MFGILLFGIFQRGVGGNAGWHERVCPLLWSQKALKRCHVIIAVEASFWLAHIAQHCEASAGLTAVLRFALPDPDIGALKKASLICW